MPLRSNQWRKSNILSHITNFVIAIEANKETKYLDHEPRDTYMHGNINMYRKENTNSIRAAIVCMTNVTLYLSSHVPTKQAYVRTQLHTISSQLVLLGEIESDLIGNTTPNLGLIRLLGSLSFLTREREIESSYRPQTIWFWTEVQTPNLWGLEPETFRLQSKCVAAIQATGRWEWHQSVADRISIPGTLVTCTLSCYPTRIRCIITRSRVLFLVIRICVLCHVSHQQSRIHTPCFVATGHQFHSFRTI